MELSEMINLVLGGGLVATIAAIITLKSTVRKAKAEAEKATAEAETVRIDNTEKATRILIENIVNPLKEELNETRKDLNATKREMARLRAGLEDAEAECNALRGEVEELRLTLAAEQGDESGAPAGWGRTSWLWQRVAGNVTLEVDRVAVHPEGCPYHWRIYRPSLCAEGYAPTARAAMLAADKAQG